MKIRDDARPQATKHGFLHLGEDMQFQRRTWAIERVAWVVMVLLVLVAAAGLFASGPLSTAAVSDQSGLVHVRYERFARSSAPSLLRIELAPGAASSSTVTLELNRAFSDAMQIERMQPAPSRERAGADGGLILEFEVAEPGRPAFVQVFLKAKEIGLVEGTLGLRGHLPARLPSSSILERASIMDAVFRAAAMYFCFSSCSGCPGGECSPSSPPLISCCC